jgi:hypothetical protein
VWRRQHKNGFEGALDPWCRALWSSLRQRCPLPPNAEEPHDADDTVPPLGSPKFTVRQVADAGDGHYRTLAQAAAIMDQVRAAAFASPFYLCVSQKRLHWVEVLPAVWCATVCVRPAESIQTDLSYLTHMHVLLLSAQVVFFHHGECWMSCDR